MGAINGWKALVAGGMGGPSIVRALIDQGMAA